jgi:hypothetical protein
MPNSATKPSPRLDSEMADGKLLIPHRKISQNIGFSLAVLLKRYHAGADN